VLAISPGLFIVFFLVFFFITRYSPLFFLFIMLARQAILKASKATYATAAYQASNGIKVFSTEESGQTAALALVVKGGARAESKEQAGVAHFLKNYGFKVNDLKWKERKWLNFTKNGGE
jgi:hypothetical protein